MLTSWILFIHVQPCTKIKISDCHHDHNVLITKDKLLIWPTKTYILQENGRKLKIFSIYDEDPIYPQTGNE